MLFINEEWLEEKRKQKKRRREQIAFVSDVGTAIPLFNHMMGSGSSINIGDSGSGGMNESLEPISSNSEIVLLSEFKKQVKRFNITDEDLEDLYEQLKTRKPDADLGGAVYKFRWAPKSWNRGKRGATRVIYIYIIEQKIVYLAKLFAKNEKENISVNELKELKGVKKDLEKRGNDNE